MCRFSGPVRDVSSTRIFAGDLPDGRQSLIYEMTVTYDDPVAMVLPLPVPADGPDDAVTFVDLSRSPDLFDRLAQAFEVHGDSRARGGAVAVAGPLAVQVVGNYEASFVPRARDFVRLDRRFRLAPDVLAALPEYADWGFAVFQLRAAASARGARFHPMGLRFPRRDRTALFFPTGHVHDGVVHPRAHYDHSLYAQVSPSIAAHLRWERSGHRARSLPALDCAATGLDPGRHVFAATLKGEHRNGDGWLRAPSFDLPPLAGPHHRCLVLAPGLVDEMPDVEVDVGAYRQALDVAVEVLAGELPGFLDERAGAWALGTLDDDAVVVEHGGRRGDPYELRALAFDLSYGQSWGGVQPKVTLGFAREPDEQLRRTIHRTLMTGLRERWAARMPPPS